MPGGMAVIDDCAHFFTQSFRKAQPIGCTLVGPRFRPLKDRGPALNLLRACVSNGLMGTTSRSSPLGPGPDLFQPVVEQAPDAMIFADREGTIRVWNIRAEEMFGYAASEATGRSLDLIIPQHLRAAHWQGYHRAIAAGRIQSDGKPMLTRAAHKDGSKIYVELAFGIVSGEHGVLGALATARKSLKP
jgi:PAS domain S-box-containing protein